MNPFKVSIFEFFGELFAIGVEATIMITIAVIADGISIILAIVELLGVTIPFVWIFDVVMAVIFLAWQLTRGFAYKATRKVTQKVSQATGIENKNQKPESRVIKAGKGAAKAGVKGGETIISFIVYIVSKFVPVVGQMFPGYTLAVITALALQVIG